MSVGLGRRVSVVAADFLPFAIFLLDLSMGSDISALNGRPVTLPVAVVIRFQLALTVLKGSPDVPRGGGTDLGASASPECNWSEQLLTGKAEEMICKYYITIYYTFSVHIYTGWNRQDCTMRTFSPRLICRVGTSSDLLS